MQFVASPLSRLAVHAFTMMWTIATIPSVAAAQNLADPPGPPTEAESRMCADQEALFASRMAFIEAKIALKPEQRAEWDAYVAASREAEKPLRELCGTPPPTREGDVLAALEARDRMDIAREDAHKAMRNAAARLKAGLADEQRRRLAEALLAPPFATRGPGFGPPPGPLHHVAKADCHPHPGAPPRP